MALSRWAFQPGGSLGNSCAVSVRGVVEVVLSPSPQPPATDAVAATSSGISRLRARLTAKSLPPHPNAPSRIRSWASPDGEPCRGFEALGGLFCSVVQPHVVIGGTSS